MSLVLGQREGPKTLKTSVDELPHFEGSLDSKRHIRLHELILIDFESRLNRDMTPPKSALGFRERKAHSAIFAIFSTGLQLAHCVLYT